MHNPYAPGTIRHEAYERAAAWVPKRGQLPGAHDLVIKQAAAINAHIATGGAVHYQRSAIFPWRRIVEATPVGAMIRLQFEDGAFRLCRCWQAAVDAAEGYTIRYNMREGT